MVCFDTFFYFRMCFAPQRRALFQYLNFQKCSEPDFFWHFLLQKVLRARTACNFSALIRQLPPHPRAYFSTLRSHKKTGKTLCFATSLPFRAPASSVFWLSPSLSFSLLTFSTSEFLPGCAFSISPYCRKFSFQTSFDKVILMTHFWWFSMWCQGIYISVPSGKLSSVQNLCWLMSSSWIKIGDHFIIQKSYSYRPTSLMEWDTILNTVQLS